MNAPIQPPVAALPFDPEAHLLLTGGTGFFGTALLRHWAEQGADMPRVTVLSRNPTAFAASQPELAALPRLRWVQGDIMDTLTQAEDDYSHVLHAAAESTHGPRLTPLQRFDQVMLGTRHVLDLALRCGVRRFLLTSSGGVYGSIDPGARGVAEHCHSMPDPMQPAHSFNTAKRCAEHLCALYAEHFEVVVARCFAFIGRDLPRRAHFAAGNFIHDALHAPQITVQGDGRAIRSYMDQRDLAHWLLQLLAHGHSGQAYNVGSDRPIGIHELALLVRDTLAPDKGVQVLGQPDAGAVRSFYVPDISKARTHLGLELRYDLAAAIRAAANSSS